jgi:hypothetical protein
LLPCGRLDPASFAVVRLTLAFRGLFDGADVARSRCLEEKLDVSIDEVNVLGGV